MQNIRLFDCDSFTEVPGDYSYLGNTLIDVIKKQADKFFDIKLLADKYKIGKDSKIDILALDNDFSPVVVLLQKCAGENIITQGIFSIDWIIQRKAAFNKLVSKAFPDIPIEKINWTGARLLCISGDFSIYDRYTVSHINRNIELIRYRKYPNSLLLFEVVSESDTENIIEAPKEDKISTNSAAADIAKAMVTAKVTSTVKPANAVTPTKPTKPAKPAKPAKPTKPAKPVKHAKPVKYVKQLKLVKTEEPGEAVGSAAIAPAVIAPAKIEEPAATINIEKCLQNEGIKQNKPISTISRIGYCRIKNNKHYALIPNREEKEITEIPAAIYLAQGQFVLIDEFGRFKHAFPHGMGGSELPQAVNSFAVANVNEIGITIDKGDNIQLKLENIPANVQLRDKNIISVDSKNKFIRFYKPIKHNADSFMPSVKAKGHQMVFVLKLLTDGAMLRDIETGKEFYKQIYPNNQIIREGQVVCLQDNNVAAAFNSSRFYTLSSYYNNFEYGTVEIKDGLAFLLKLTGEKVIIKDAPTHLYQGQVAYVDENNNFCGIEDNGDVNESDTVKRNVTNLRAYRKTNRNCKVEVIKKVLILGNNSYANSYKLTFLKYGYRAEVLEGFEPWSKINSELKETDIVVVVTSHISHDNMWRIKKEVNDIPVVYSEFDGANRMLEQLMSAEQDQERREHLSAGLET